MRYAYSALLLLFSPELGLTDLHLPMTEQTPKESQTPDTRQGAKVGLIIVLLLVFGGLFLVRVLHKTSQLQDCVMSGRTNCAPVDGASPGN